jgi:class 3 adenylate cyclase/tetratricopeptide (TPR) repeat protein
VSVLFVDLVGFTSYSEGRDAEEVRDLLSLYFGRAEEIIRLYGGIVEKFIGDAVMAVWGTPVAREDDPGRAVRASLELIESVAALGRSVGTDLKARGGIFTGEAAVNLAARGQGMVAGDTVNTASRLQSAAEPGHVLVDRSTYLGARNAVSFKEAGRIALKGKDEEVEVWSPKQVVAALGGFRPDESLEPAFTGRDEEFRLIKDLLHVTARERKPRLASVIGVGGIGKSRLVWELLKYIDGLSDVIAWHQGRSPSYGDGVAFWALAEMVRMRARIAETDDDDTARAKLDESVDDYFPDAEEAGWLRPYLHQLVGTEEAADAGREQLFAAWRTFFERIAEIDPVVMIFEDLHWADPGLIDFIEYLMTTARTSPILILTLARPELIEKRPTWGAGQRSFTSIHLERLEKDDMTLLLKSVAGDLPGQIHQEIIDRSEGVPLYAVEMVRMLIDRESLVKDGDGYRWVGGAEHVAVPDSLHSLIASRLDTLETSDRLLVQDASVLGKTFTLNALEAVTSRSGDELKRRLSDLVRREILLVDTDPRSPERGQYGFVQSLIREVAYQTLSNQTRRDRHVAAAEFFSSTGDIDVIDVVATHYVEACANCSKNDSLFGSLAERARSSVVMAAERAKALGSSVQAVSLLSKALAITPHGDQRARLLFRSGSAARDASMLEQGVAELEEAVRLLEGSEDFDFRSEVQAALASALYFAGRLEDAERTLLSALELLDDPRSNPAAARLYVELSRIFMFKGDKEKSEKYGSLGIVAAERLEDHALIAEALITRAIGGLSVRPIEGHILLKGVLDYAEVHGLIPQQLRAYINLSANQSAEDAKAAAETAGKGRMLAQKYGHLSQAYFLAGNEINSSLEFGDFNRARDVLAEYRDVLEESISLLIAGCIYEALTGDLDSARRLEAVLAERTDPSNVSDTALLACVQSSLAFVEGDYAECLRLGEYGEDDSIFFQMSNSGMLESAALWSRDLERARKLLEVVDHHNLRNPWQAARRATLQAGITALEGDREKATEQFRTVIAHLRDLAIPWSRAMAELDLVLLIGGPETAEAAASAQSYFSESGCEPFLRVLREAAV